MSLGLRTTGRSKAPLTGEIVGDLDLSDIEATHMSKGTAAPHVGKLRERHHHLARLLAEGVQDGEAAIVTRYTASRVSILKSDPAFQDLVAHYRKQVNLQFVDMQKKLADLGMDAANEIQDRLEEAPEEIPFGQLMALLTLSADRTGHGPSSKTELNVKVGLADRLMQARKRVDSMRDITPEAGDE